MADTETREIYGAAGLGQSVSLGTRPAVLVVDFSCGFTDPDCSLGSEMSAEVTATAALLDIARAKDFPIIFTTIAFDPTLNDAGIWPQKSPTLRDLESGSRWVEIDPRLSRRTDEIVIVKKGASAFFGTNLVSILISQRVDSVILCGATTSGCIRATAIDLLQYGFPTLVPQQCVADRATAPHHANLFDIDSKYANVVPLEDVLSYIDRLTSEQAARI